MVLQVFADDSGTEAENFVLAGYLATAEEWIRFSNEWAPLAKRWGVLQKDGGYVFHMTEMAWGKERRERVSAFYRIIEKHKLSAFAFGINKRSHRRAISRLSVKNHDLDLNSLSNSYMLLFFFLIANLIEVVNKHPELFDPADQIDFIFDIQTERKQIWAAWDEFVEASSQKFRDRLGAHPRFESDRKFMPLQAADFLAWWNSRWMDQGLRGPEGADFEWFQGNKVMPFARHIVSEDEAVHTLKKIIRHHYPDAVIYEHVMKWC